MRGLLGPKALFAGGVVVLALIVTALAGLVLDSRRDCNARIQSRSDQRAMWLYIADEFPDADFIVDLIVQLNARLPALECRGFINVDPVPVEDR